MFLEGAAWASLIAQAVMAIMAFVLLWFKSAISLKLRFPIHPEMRRLIGMSLNLFVRTLSLNIALMLAVREATALGDRYIGAHTIAINLWLLAAFFIDGYSAAGNSMGGRLYGANDKKGLWKLAKYVNGYAQIISLALLVGGLLAYKPIGSLFTKDAAVLQTFYVIFPWVIWALPINALAFVFDGLFKGMGQMKYLRNVLLVATFLGFIPTLYLGKYLHWGLQGIWVAFLVWMALRSFSLWYRFRVMFAGN
jgi:Na+-driven multidrug efflux pump